jgi:hypothetical protein
MQRFLFSRLSGFNSRLGEINSRFGDTGIATQQIDKADKNHPTNGQFDEIPGYIPGSRELAGAQVLDGFVAAEQVEEGAQCPIPFVFPPDPFTLPVL